MNPNPATMNSNSTATYVKFLFNPDGSVKPRYQPVLSYNPKTDHFTIAYSIPGHHQPRQYFKFREIPTEFPNPFIEAVFSLFSVTPSLLYRRPRKIALRPLKTRINGYLGIPTRSPATRDPEIVEIAQYNCELAVFLGRRDHSCAYFPMYLENYKILNPKLKYNESRILALYNSLISVI